MFRGNTTDTDKTWLTWIQTFTQVETLAGNTVTLQTLHAVLQLQYNKYLSMKGNEKMLEQPQDLVQFHVWGGSGKDRCKAHVKSVNRFRRNHNNDKHRDCSGSRGRRYQSSSKEHSPGDSRAALPLASASGPVQEDQKKSANFVCPNTSSKGCELPFSTIFAEAVTVT